MTIPEGNEGARGIAVPLSEDEQRILYEIEQSFYENDPAFAGKVRSSTLYRHAGRNCKWAALGMLVGLVITIASFISSLLLAALGFLIMLGSAFVFERNLRKMGRAGWRQVTDSVRSRGMADVVGDTRRRLRSRFRRPE